MLHSQAPAAAKAAMFARSLHCSGWKKVVVRLCSQQQEHRFFSTEKAKRLHQSLQEGLQPKQPAAGSTPAATSSVRHRQRLQQAVINGVCSFMVVLLAAQSLKAGSERKHAIDHLEAATEVLSRKKEKLQQVANQATAAELATVCIELIEQRRAHSQNTDTWYWWRERSTDKLLEENDFREELEAALRGKLEGIVNQETLSETEKEQKQVQELVAAIESPTNSKSRVFSI